MVVPKSNLSGRIFSRGWILNDSELILGFMKTKILDLQLERITFFEKLKLAPMKFFLFDWYKRPILAN